MNYKFSFLELKNALLLLILSELVNSWARLTFVSKKALDDKSTFCFQNALADLGFSRKGARFLGMVQVAIFLVRSAVNDSADLAPVQSPCAH